LAILTWKFLSIWDLLTMILGRTPMHSDRDQGTVCRKSSH